MGTICRVALVNLTDQTGPKRVEMSAKTGTYECFIFLFANKTKGAFCVFQPWNPSIQPKTSYQSNVSMKTADQIRKLFRNRPKLARGCFFQCKLAQRIDQGGQLLTYPTYRILRYTIVFHVK